MTYDDWRRSAVLQEGLLKEFIENNGIIVCKTAQQRNDVLRYLADIGFRLTATAEMHVRHNELDGDFLNPGYNGMDTWGNSIVDCYSVRSVSNTARPTIDFSSISHLIYGLPDQTKEEFDAAFAAFFSGEEVPT